MEDNGFELNFGDFKDIDINAKELEENIETPKTPIEERRSEICYHEAAHYVIGSIISQMDYGFVIPRSIQVRVKLNETFLAEVMGFIPENVREMIFFEEKKERKLLNILMLLAGYTSYLAFVRETSHFIVSFMLDKNSPITNPHNVQSKSIIELLNAPSLNPQHDFAKVRLILRSSSEKLKLINFLVEKLKVFIQLEDINQAIQIVHDTLMESDGEIIEGDTLQVLEKKISSLIQTYDFKDLLKEIGTKFS